MTTPSFPSVALAYFVPAHGLAHNVTASDDRVGWVSSGSRRSTSDILWSCFSILFVCTYKCVHLNVPNRKESEAGCSKWCGVYLPEKLLLWKWMKKVGWMILIVLMPEIGVAMAMDQWLFARECREEWRVMKGKNGNDSNVVEDGTKDVEFAMIDVNMEEGEEQEFANTHGFFTNMGGFSMRIIAISPPQQDRAQNGLVSQVSPLEQGQIQREDISQDHLAQTENTVLATYKPLSTIHEVSCLVNDWEDLRFYLNTFPGLKLPSEKEITNLSKADAFTKAFACIQSSWLIIQSIVRVSVGLPITQLELATMAFVFCALIMYLLWWNKPFGVENRASITVITYDDNAKRAVAERLSESLFPNDRRGLLYFEKVLGVQNGEELLPEAFDEAKKYVAQMDQERRVPDLTLFGFTSQITSGILQIAESAFIYLRWILRAIFRNAFGDSILVPPSRSQTVSLVFSGIGMLFSGFHVAAWNWTFPSSIVRILWRIIGVAATSTGPILILYVAILFVFRKYFSLHGHEAMIGFVAFLVLLVYAISRIGLVVLIFYCFSSMPAGVYETVDWLQFLPHFS